MSEYINEIVLAKEVMEAIDNNLKGQARRMFTDSYNAVQQPVVEFIRNIATELDKKFSN